MDDDVWIPPWDRLGIAPDADVAAIRRAYAARIKVVRPDVDPVGFQRLVTARDDMLRQARQGGGAPPASVAVDDGDDGAEDGDVMPVEAVPPRRPATGEPPSTAERVVVQAEPAPAPAQPTVEPVVVVSGAPADEDPGPAAPPSVMTPPPATDAYDIVLLLRDGRAADAPLSPAALDTVLAGLPVGAGRWYESEVIEALSEAVAAFEVGPVAVDVLRGYEHAACLLTEHFAWEERDRAIHETLDREDARRLLVFLGRAHRRLIPDYHGRFYRLEAAVSAAAATAPQGWLSRINWRTVFWWWLAFTLLANLSKCFKGG